MNGEMDRRVVMNKHILFKNLILVLFITCAIMLIMPQTTFANITGVKIVGDNCGLVIEASAEKEDTSNLNPGDIKCSKLILKNEGEGSLGVSIKTNIIAGSEASPRGGKLADILKLTIMDEDKVIIDDLTFREAAKLSGKDLGTMKIGEKKVLDYIIEFPSSADNDYQGATFQANWTFTTKCSTSGGGGGGGRTGGGGGGPGEEDTPETDIIITDDDVTYGPAEMPGTGEVATLYFYGAGALIVMLGIALRRK
jgi:hypothetical protein